MKKFLFMLIVFSLYFFSCKQKEDKEPNEDARELFNRSVSLIIDITSKIKNSSDSTEVDSLSQIFEKKITDLNFEFPSLTDLKLNEIENDSLYKLLQSMKNEKSIKLKELSESISDTIPEQSVEL